MMTRNLNVRSAVTLLLRCQCVVSWLAWVGSDTLGLQQDKGTSLSVDLHQPQPPMQITNGPISASITGGISLGL